MIIFEPHLSGVSGDMRLGALVDLGADFSLLERFVSVKNVKGLSGLEIKKEKLKKKGISATRIEIILDEQARGRHGHEMFEILDHASEAVSASSWAQQKAKEAILCLLEAEANVHGENAKEVHLHETGSFDTILDCLGYFMLLESLGEKEILSTSICVGSGVVNTCHGLLPVPVPAVTAMACSKGIPIVGSKVEEELATPTGVALLAVSAVFCKALPSIVPLKVGYGAGSKNLEVSNVLRATVASEENVEETILIETTLDDITGEEIGYAISKLQETSKEVHLLQGLGKKNRPVFVLRLLVDLKELDLAIKALFEHTTTIGVRYWPVSRAKMERAVEAIPYGDGFVRVKVSRHGDLQKEKIEFNDLMADKGDQ